VAEAVQASAMMRIGRIKHSQTMLFSEAEFVECADEPGEILEGEDRFGANMNGPQIQ